RAIPRASEEAATVECNHATGGAAGIGGNDGHGMVADSTMSGGSVCAYLLARMRPQAGSRHLKQIHLGKKVDQLVQLISRHVSPWRDQLASRAARLTTERLTSSPYCSRIGPSFRCRQTRS